MSNTTSPAGFDPWNQVITLRLQDGSTINSTTTDIDAYYTWCMRLGFNFSSQIGASIVLLFVLVLLTKREKLRSSIFIMNATCLILNIIRTVLQCLALAGGYFKAFTVLAGDYARITTSDRAITATSDIMTTLLTICIMISLSLQVQVVCCTTSKTQRFWIMLGTTVAAIIAITFRVLVAVFNIIQTDENQTMDAYLEYRTAQIVTQAIAIWVFSFVFTFKLGYALLQRRKLGMSQFGPMQIIFVMGCQTMIIPGIFSCLQFLDTVPELGSQGLTIVCIFLPLSAIWAGLVTTDARLASSGPNAHRLLLAGQFNRSQSSTVHHSRDRDTYGSASCASRSYKDPDSPTTPFTEKMEMSGGITVGREWTVKHGDADAGDMV